MSALKVTFGIRFKKEMLNFPTEDARKIRHFVKHVKEYGLKNLQGRNKPSDEVPTDDPNWREKVRYAQIHNLWHYHIGIPDYADGVKGDKTSEYILHYIRDDRMIKIVDFNRHPPFRLPTTDYLT